MPTGITTQVGDYKTATAVPLVGVRDVSSQPVQNDKKQSQVPHITILKCNRCSQW